MLKLIMGMFRGFYAIRTWQTVYQVSWSMKQDGKAGCADPSHLFLKSKL